jgi:hypothetical protein
MKKLFLFSFLCLAACNSSTELKEGRWTGHLTPMNHPELSIPVNFDGTHTERGLKVTIIGSNGVPAVTRNPHLKDDTLFFVFDEPEEQVRLECALARTDTMGFSGKCTDSSGKWAMFTMIPPV